MGLPLGASGLVWVLLAGATAFVAVSVTVLPTAAARANECGVAASVAAELDLEGVRGEIGPPYGELGESLDCHSEFHRVGLEVLKSGDAPKLYRIFYRGKDRAIVEIEYPPKGGCGTARNERLGLTRSGAAWRITRRDPVPDMIYDCFSG